MIFKDISMIPYYKRTKIEIGYIRETFNIVDDRGREKVINKSLDSTAWSVRICCRPPSFFQGYMHMHLLIIWPSKYLTSLLKDHSPGSLEKVERNFFFFNAFPGLPWWSSGQDITLSTQGVWVWSLVKELDPTCCK